MGLILLDLSFRIEKGFDVKLGRNWWVDELGLLWGPDEVRDISLGDLHAEILKECRSQNVEPPPDSWALLVNFVASAAGFEPREVLPETMLLRDVAPDG